MRLWARVNVCRLSNFSTLLLARGKAKSVLFLFLSLLSFSLASVSLCKLKSCVSVCVFSLLAYWMRASKRAFNVWWPQTTSTTWASSTRIVLLPAVWLACKPNASLFNSLCLLKQKKLESQNWICQARALCCLTWGQPCELVRVISLVVAGGAQSGSPMSAYLASSYLISCSSTSSCLLAFFSIALFGDFFCFVSQVLFLLLHHCWFKCFLHKHTHTHTYTQTKSNCKLGASEAPMLTCGGGVCVPICVYVRLYVCVCESLCCMLCMCVSACAVRWFLYSFGHHMELDMGAVQIAAYFNGWSS